MLSRVAQNIYWLARYLERAENTARLIIVSTHLQLDLPKAVRPGWTPLIAITGGDELYQNHYRGYSEADVVRFLINDERNPASILNSLKYARENARTMRDFLPRDGWELLNETYRRARSDAYQGIMQRSRYAYLSQLIQSIQALTGLFSGTMTHDAGYACLRIGRNLERADMTTRIIDVRSGSQLPDGTEWEPYEGVQWISVLRSMGAYQMFRRQTQQAVGWSSVLKFLFKDRQFPRAFAFCLSELAYELQALPNSEEQVAQAEELLERISQLDPEQLDPNGLHQLVDDLQLDLGLLHQAISQRYFTYQ